MKSFPSFLYGAKKPKTAARCVTDAFSRKYNYVRTSHIYGLRLRLFQLKLELIWLISDTILYCFKKSTMKNHTKFLMPQQAFFVILRHRLSSKVQSAVGWSYKKSAQYEMGESQFDRFIIVDCEWRTIMFIWRRNENVIQYLCDYEL